MFTETLTESMVSQWNSSGIFPRIQYFAAQRQSQKFTVQIGRNTRKLHRKNHIHVDVQKTMKNVWQMIDSYLCMQEDLEKDNGHSLVLVLKRSGTLSKKTVHQEFVTNLQKKRCCWNSLRADVQFSALRLHCPESTQEQGTW